MLIRNRISYVLIFGDSKLAIKAVKYRSPLQNSSLARIQLIILDNLKEILHVDFFHILRERNSDANAFSNMATIGRKGCYVNHIGEESHYETIP